MSIGFLVLALIIIVLVVFGVLAVAAFVYFVMYKGRRNETPPEKYRD